MKYLIVFVYASLWKVCDMAVDKDPLQAVSQSNWQFSSSMYTAISSAADPAGNIIFSPFSVQVILALCSVGAGGETAEQMIQGLHLSGRADDFKIGFQNLLKSLQTSGKVTLETANEVFPSVRFPVLESFSEAAREFFFADVENVNYGESVDAAETMNKWVKKQTHKKITNIVSADSLDASTAMILVNAVYFKGEWDQGFDKELTSKGIFYVNGKHEKSVNMMQATSSFKSAISIEIDAKLVELPYKNKKMSLIIILPLEKDGLPDVEAKMTTMDLQSVFESIEHNGMVELHLPVFEMQQSIKLGEILKQLGMVKMFSGDADFSAISEEKGLSVGDVLHKATIEVNEEGTVAAAETSVVVSSRNASPHVEVFLVDHPFAFALISRQSNVVLFMGRYTGAEGVTSFTHKTPPHSKGFRVVGLTRRGKVASGSSDDARSGDGTPQPAVTTTTGTTSSADALSSRGMMIIALSIIRSCRYCL